MWGSVQEKKPFYQGFSLIRSPKLNFGIRSRYNAGALHDTILCPRRVPELTMNPGNHFAFTIIRLDAIRPPAQGRTRFHDSEAPGLFLTVTAAGSKAFYFLRRSPHTSRVVKVKLGPWPNGIAITKLCETA